MTVGDVLKIGAVEYIIIAVPEETGRGYLVRSLCSKEAQYIPAGIYDDAVIRNDTIYYGDGELIKKNKKRQEALLQCYMELGNLLGQDMAEPFEFSPFAMEDISEMEIE